MKKQKLNYRFYNPNPADLTAGYLVSILIDANRERVNSAIQAEQNRMYYEKDINN